MKPVALHILLHIFTESDFFIACIIIVYVIIFKLSTGDAE